MAIPIVSTKYGKLQGIVMKGVLKTTYIAFKGIPFAAPPIGKLRFKDPVPPAAWSGIRDASKTVGDCSTQYNVYSPSEMKGSEDCLYLNVYTPTATSETTSKTAVMVWIHGGAFQYGSGIDTFTGPDYLITRNIILVSINYRLGVFGFFNLGHKIASGNQGLKDQVAALRWVKENISNFGGDPNNVTIFGTSAGAACVHLLTLSPMAKGLFHKAIMQSGNSKCFWGLNRRTDSSQNCFKIASMLGTSSTDPIEVVTFLRSVSVSRIMEAQKILNSKSLSIPFQPDIDVEAENPIIPRPINELMNAVDLPIIIGHTSDEFIGILENCNIDVLQWFSNNLEIFVQKFTFLQDSEQVGKLTEEIRQRYHIPKSISEESVASLIELLGNVYIKYHVKEVANDLRRRNCAPTYLYQFSYTGNEMTLARVITKKILISGAFHSDDSTYLFYLPQNKTENPAPPAIGTKDRITLERLVRMWTNFAITGNPTSELDEYVTIPWDPATSGSFNCLNINDDLKMSIVDYSFNKFIKNILNNMNS